MHQLAMSSKTLKFIKRRAPGAWAECVHLSAGWPMKTPGSGFRVLETAFLYTHPSQIRTFGV